MAVWAASAPASWTFFFLSSHLWCERSEERRVEKLGGVEEAEMKRERDDMTSTLSAPSESHLSS